MRRLPIRLAAFLLVLSAGATFGGALGAATPPLMGVNISGAELNPASEGRINFDYVYPSAAEIDGVAADGLNAIRLPVLWERLQPDLSAGLEPGELARVQATVQAAAPHHLTVIVDVHNYGRYQGKPVGSAAVPAAAFARFWGLMAAAFKTNTSVDFDLMNEPTGMSTESWRDSAQAAVNAIRAAGARNRVFVPGAGWDGAHDFVTGRGGLPNATALAELRDPADNTTIEVHQYLDADNSGTKPDCRSPADSVATLQPFTDWARSQHRRGFLGEFGASAAPDCLASLAAMLRYMAANADVWQGWTYWAAGPWWGSYPFSVEPDHGTERPQMRVLKAAALSPHGSRP